MNKYRKTWRRTRTPKSRYLKVANHKPLAPETG